MNDELIRMICAGFFMVSTVIFFYYLYQTIKAYLRCKPEKEDIPCPNTCNPGYECKQSDAPADFVIGEVVEEFSEADAETEAMPELVPEAEAPVADAPAEAVAEAAI